MTVAEWKPRYPPVLIALTVTLATFMEILDTSIANVALPHIAGNLSASIDESTWVLTSYLVANAVVLPLNGFFSKLLGRKRFYMISVAFFTLSSFLCGLAPNLGFLVFFRILQGLGGGGLQPSEQAILVDTFPPHKRGMGMAIYGMAVVTAPVIGPTLGGFITDHVSWRWIFFINIPVGLLSLFLTSRVLEDPPHLRRRVQGEKKMSIDYIGLALLTIGLAALQIVLDKGEREDWLDSHFIVFFLVVAVLGLIGAAIWELIVKEPIVDFHLLKERNFLASSLLMFFLGFTLYGSTVLLPLFLQTLMGYSSLLSGMALSPGGLVTMALMPVVGFLLMKRDGRFLILIGLMVGGVGLLYMAHFNLAIDFKTAMTSRMIQACGLAFLFVPINAMAFAFVPKEKSNHATGIMNLARNIGGSVGIAFVATMLSRRTQFHRTRLIEHLTPGDLPYESFLSKISAYLSTHGRPVGDLAAQSYHMLDRFVEREAAMLAYVDVFRIMAYIFFGMILLLPLLKKIPDTARSIAVH